MKQLVAFMKKDMLQQRRTGRLLILGILFVIFGIMNPAVAKLTPWLLEVLSEDLAASGMSVSVVTVTAMDSWVQFFKNIPMALIAFVLLESNILTGEYRSGTLVLSLTKGLRRSSVVVSKSLLLGVLWTVGFWFCFAITYGYNAYFWDNSVAQSLIFSAVSWWLFGLWVVSLMILFSAFASANTGVLIGVGGVVLISFLIGLLPRIGEYLPTRLLDGNSLIYGAAEASAYSASFIIVVVLCALSFAAGICIFSKKQL